MSKITGLASFTKRGMPSPDPVVQTSAEVGNADTVSMEPPIQARQRAQKSVVAMSFRISRVDWERLHQLAMTDGVSINTLTLRGLSKLFEERGLPGISTKNT